MSSSLSFSPFFPSCSCGDHAVQFYDQEEFFVARVGRFIADALRDVQNTLVIATAAHRQALAEHLQAQGLDVAMLASAGRYVALDAAECLGAFMRRGIVDARLFGERLGPEIARLSASARLAAYGEMVALLVGEGRTEEALQLEGLWNGLQQRHDFRLLCAYPMRSFASHGAREVFRRICAAHRDVRPAESFPESDGQQQARAVAELQQRAAALDGELARRQRAEDALERRESALRSVAEPMPLGLHWIDGGDLRDQAGATA